MVDQRVTKRGVRAGARSVDELRRPGVDPALSAGQKTPSQLAVAIAEIASQGRPTEQQIDELRAQFPTVAIVTFGTDDPHHKLGMSKPEGASNTPNYKVRGVAQPRPRLHASRKPRKPRKGSSD